MGAGYQEVVGTAEPITRTARTLQAAQQLLTTGRVEEAAARLAPPGPSPEQLLGYLKCLRRLERGTFLPEAVAACERFPADLRFPLLLSTHPDETQRGTAWKGILSRLVEGSARFRRYYRSSVCRTAADRLVKRGDGEEVARQLLDLYPGSSVLQHALALHAERNERFEEAAARYGEVIRAREEFEAEGEYLAAIAPNPLYCSWEGAVELAGEHHRKGGPQRGPKRGR
jgi:hypothetical protein